MTTKTSQKSTQVLSHEEAQRRIDSVNTTKLIAFMFLIGMIISSLLLLAGLIMITPAKTVYDNGFDDGLPLFLFGLLGGTVCGTLALLSGIIGAARSDVKVSEEDKADYEKATKYLGWTIWLPLMSPLVLMMLTFGSMIVISINS